MKEILSLALGISNRRSTAQLPTFFPLSQLLIVESCAPMSGCAKWEPTRIWHIALCVTGQPETSKNSSEKKCRKLRIFFHNIGVLPPKFGVATMINTLIIIQWANWAMMQGHRLSDLHAALQGKRRSCWEATENRRAAYTPLIVVFSFYNGTRWWTIHLLPYHSWINNRLSIHTYCCIFLADIPSPQR